MERRLNTRITEMLGIERPILSGAMQWLAKAELVAAVSNAGGLGVMSSATFPNAEELRAELEKLLRKIETLREMSGEEAGRLADECASQVRMLIDRG